MLYLLIFLTLLLLLFLLSMIWPPDSPWSPWWRTNKKVAHAIIKLAEITNKDVLIDLGCGDGTVLIEAASLRNAHGVGIEIDPLRVSVARLRIQAKGLTSVVEVKRENFFDTNISEASVVIVYLIPKTLKRLESKFFKELKPGSRVVSYIYQIDFLPEIKRDKKNQIFVYRIPTNTEKN